MRKLLSLAICGIGLATSASAALPYDNEQWQEMEGTGTFFNGFFSDVDNTGQLVVEIHVQQSVTTPGLYKILDPWSAQGSTTPLIIDATNPDCVVVLEQTTGVVDRWMGMDSEIFAVSCSQYYVTGLKPGSTYQDFLEGEYSSCNITFKDGIFTIPISGLVMRAPDYAALDPEYEYLKTEPSLIVLPGTPTPWEYDWTDLGRGEFANGLVYGALYDPEFENTLEDYTYSVAIQSNNQKDGVYRVLKANNLFGSWQNLVIDASNPDCVIIDEQETGFFSLKTWLSHSAYYIGEGEGKMTMEEFLDSDEILYNITLSDNTIWLPANCMFFCDFIGQKKQFDHSLDGYIKLPEKEGGIQDIAVENQSEAPVEYYNLQGIRVDNPSNGIFIRRQGKHTSKVLIR